ncbi:MAG: hypothetical protein AB7F59_10290 [Bdellovibrionales bacterium]
MKKLFFAVSILVLGIGLFYQLEIKNFYYKTNHNGLINYDYGIISVEDLNKSDENSFPAVRFNGVDTGYPYWQCFNKKYLKMACSYNEPLDQQGSSLGIDIETSSEIHSYSLNHAVSGEVCDDLVAQVNNVLKDQTYFCINGYLGTLDRVSAKREYSWLFKRIKTKSGYAHYFIEEE